MLAVASAIPLTMALQMVDTPLKWFMLTPIFYLCIEATLKEILTRAVIFGATASVLNFFWLFGSTNNYTGSGYLLGILLITVFSLVFSAYTMLVGLVYHYFLRQKRQNSLDWLYISLSGGSFFVLLDLTMEKLGRSFATCLYMNYIPFADNLYAIQPSAVLGPYVITFVIAVFDYQVAYFLRFKQWKKLLIPAGVLMLYLGWGKYLYDSFCKDTGNDLVGNRTFKAAILSENLPPSESWNSANGNFIAGQSFALARAAAQGNAKLAVWSETAIPWTYRPDDDFIKVLDSLTSPYGLVHLLGINTEYHGRTYYNSVYCIAPGRKVLGRYDKREALSLAEKPWMGILLPFFTNNGFRVKEGVSVTPLPTPYGKAGMMLCNESVTRGPAWSMVKNAAQFLVNQGNDGWFADTYLSRQHFYYSRMRAVETRKDVIVDNNNGYCGLIQASGNIVAQENNAGPKVLFVDVTPNDYDPHSLHYAKYFSWLAISLFVGLTVLNYLKGRRE